MLLMYMSAYAGSQKEPSLDSHGRHHGMSFGADTDLGQLTADPEKTSQPQAATGKHRQTLISTWSPEQSP